MDLPITKTKVSYKLDLEDEFNKKDIAPSKRKTLSELVGVALLDEMVSYLDRGVTPVSKGKYKKSLDKDYKAAKVKAGGKSYSDMQLEGSMLSNGTVVATKSGV